MNWSVTRVVSVLGVESLVPASQLSYFSIHKRMGDHSAIMGAILAFLYIRVSPDSRRILSLHRILVTTGFYIVNYSERMIYTSESYLLWSVVERRLFLWVRESVLAWRASRVVVVFCPIIMPFRGFISFRRFISCH